MIPRIAIITLFSVPALAGEFVVASDGAPHDDDSVEVAEVDATSASQVPVSADLPPADVSDPASVLAIYPRFEKHELPLSIQAVLDAARTCTVRGRSTRNPRTKGAVAPYVSATVVDGEPVDLVVREVDLSCGTTPIRRCSYAYSWDENSEELYYASVQCYGSHADSYTTYVVTASQDVRKAKAPGVVGTSKDKAIHGLSLSFQTTDFPGTHISAYTALRRADSRVVTPPQVSRFDDYEGRDEAEGAPIDAATLKSLADDIAATACLGVGACDP